MQRANVTAGFRWPPVKHEKDIFGMRQNAGTITINLTSKLAKIIGTLDKNEQ